MSRKPWNEIEEAITASLPHIDAVLFDAKESLRWCDGEALRDMYHRLDALSALKGHLSAMAHVAQSHTAVEKPAETQSMLKVGDLVELLQNEDRYPHAQIGAGAVGVVVLVEHDQVCVELDDPCAGLDEWQNQIIWTHEEILPSGDSTIEASDRALATATLLLEVHPSGDRTEYPYLRILSTDESPVGWVRRRVEIAAAQVESDAVGALDKALSDHFADATMSDDEVTPEMRVAIHDAATEYLWQWLDINTGHGWTRAPRIWPREAA